MLLKMLASKVIPAPPTGSVAYVKGAQVLVDDAIAQAWLAEDPPAAEVVLVDGEPAAHEEPPT